MAQVDDIVRAAVFSADGCQNDGVCTMSAIDDAAALVERLRRVAEMLGASCHSGSAMGDAIDALERLAHERDEALNKAGELGSSHGDSRGNAARTATGEASPAVYSAEQWNELHRRYECARGSCFNLLARVAELERERDELRSAMSACHEAVGEHAGSDDATLAEGIKLRLSELRACVAELEPKARALDALETWLMSSESYRSADIRAAGSSEAIGVQLDIDGFPVSCEDGANLSAAIEAALKAVEDKA